MHQKVSTILIEIKLYIEIHVYSNSKTLFSINLLLAISTMNFATLCLNYGVVTSVTIATTVVVVELATFVVPFVIVSFKCLCVSSFEI